MGLLLLLTGVSIGSGSLLHAGPTLYNAYHPTVRGALRTVGMAGAVTAIPYPVITHNENPAGLSMFVDSIQLHLASGTIRDEYLYPPHPRADLTGSFGLGVPVYPWGWGVGRWNTQMEYDAGTNTQIFAREYRASAARLFFGDRLSLGVSGVLGEAGWERSGTALRSGSLGFGFGILYQLPHRNFLGLNYTHALNYRFDQKDIEMTSPSRIQVGYGWVPHSVFELGLTIQALAPQKGVRLLGRPEVVYGSSWTFQPRLGIRYLFLELKNLRTQLYGGTYWEASRFSGERDRLHWTGGVMIEAWVVDIGLGRDWAPQYSNVVASIGFDIIKIARILKLIPPERTQNVRGLLPHPFLESDAFLPYPVRSTKIRPDEQPDLVQITTDIPKNMQSHMSSPEMPIQNITDDLMDTVESWSQTVPEEIRKLTPGMTDRRQP